MNSRINEALVLGLTLLSVYHAKGQIVPPGHGPGWALAFGGVNQHANTLANPITIGPAITIEAWINAGAFNYGEIYALCDDPNSACNGMDYKFLDVRVNPSGQIEIGLSPTAWSSRRIYLISSVAIPPNTWTHVAGTMDLGTNSGAIYINGVSVPVTSNNIGSGTGSFTGSPAIGALQVSGATTGVQYPFTGKIDELRIWNTIIGQTSIRDYMCRNNLTGHPDLANLQALYHVEESGPNTATVWDHIGSHHATLTNVSVNDAYGLSEAALGDTSSHTYSGPNLGLGTPTESFYISSNSNAGKHIYHVDPPGANVDGTVPSGLDAAGGGCFGVFLAEAPSAFYLVNYSYTGNPELDGTAAEPGSVLLRRDGPLGTPWTQQAPQWLNQTVNVIDLQGTWQRHMQWAGAYTPVSCDNWTLTIDTDDNGNETTWQIADATTLSVIASGGPYPDNSSNTETICVPPGGCYRLTVNDSGNDGITDGGWKLLDNNGRRILDNVDNGGCFSTISTHGLAFCNEPASAQTVIGIHCDKTNWLPNDVIIASADPAVSAQWGIGDQTDDGYTFWFLDPCGSYNRRIFRNHATSGGHGPANAIRATKLKLSSMVSYPLPQNTLLNVRVRSRVNGVDGTWGPACRFKIDVNSCTLTQLNNDPMSPNFSCGVNGKVVGASGNTGRISALVVTSGGNPATHYRFNFAVPGEGYSRNLVSTNAVCQLGIWQTNPLLCGTYTYDVRVQASFDGGVTYCPYGTMCQVTITNNGPQPYCSPAGGEMVEENGPSTWMASSTDLCLYPNPNDGGPVNLMIDDLPMEETLAHVDIHDALGRRILRTSVPIQDRVLRTTLQLGHTLDAGVYLVTVTTGEQVRSGRLLVRATE